MSLNELGRAVEQEINVEVPQLPKYGRAEMTISNWETTTRTWNICVEFNVENGAIASIAFENISNPQDTLYYEDFNDLRIHYPLLMNTIDKSIFSRI